ncbi:MAG TPA: type II CAAX endopeptidase family protein [Bryobacteraceae bacterium]|nr:type II CAAX endopeptidase family protein [Bryobacteraceae bacterium]
MENRTWVASSSQYLIPALLLCVILSLLARPLQQTLARFARARRERIFLAPAVLSLLFAAVLWSRGILTPAPVGLILAYTFIPTVLAWAQRAKPVVATDFAVILLLWLPLEFAVGQSFFPRPHQGLVHSVAYGIAILLALWLFLIFRDLPGMKYNPPQWPRDLLSPLAGYAVAAPILIALGLWLGFIQPFHVPPSLTAGFVLTRFLVILAATAIPEEILFRALLQNALMQKLGFSNFVLALASLIFGCAHLNNGGGPPNWRYAIMASIAGFAYGKVFQKSSSVISSALLHALVNTSKHVFF